MLAFNPGLSAAPNRYSLWVPWVPDFLAYIYTYKMAKKSEIIDPKLLKELIDK